MIQRSLINIFKDYQKYFQIINITGPRQSGKSTFIRDAVKDLPYINLEAPDERLLAIEDPVFFLKRFPNGVILDEIQNTPELFSYIQVLTDADRSLKFYLTGSQNFNLHEKISQSLAGRVGSLTLLPFSFTELDNAGQIDKMSADQLQFTGFYPRIYDRNIPPRVFYRNYVNTYIERDIQSLVRSNNLFQFERFLHFVAGRAGQIINYQSLSNDVGVSLPTIQTWISLLERSYIIYRIPPHFENFNKRIIKSPKLYFYDTGLLCYLLNIENQEQLAVHFARGAIFENYVISELVKMRYNKGLDANISFWRDNHQNEIDALLTESGSHIAVEIKSSHSYSPSFFDGLKYWQKLNNSNKTGFVVYGGDETFETRLGKCLAWNKFQSELD